MRRIRESLLRLWHGLVRGLSWRYPTGDQSKGHRSPCHTKPT